MPLQQSRSHCKIESSYLRKILDIYVYVYIYTHIHISFFLFINKFLQFKIRYNLMIWYTCDEYIWN